MQIKQQMLAQQLQKKIVPLYVLIGQDSYLLEDSVASIKSALKQKYSYDEKIITINAAEDWNQVIEEANSYSLFSEIVLLTILLEKKSIDAAGKKALTEYLKTINTRCFIIIRAPNIPLKQLSWLSSQEHAVLSVAYSLSPDAMLQWIAKELTGRGLNFDPQVPNLIHQYTQGNMLACAQVLEKIALSVEANSTINLQQVKEQLSDQCDLDLFELVDACLLGKTDKTIQIIRYLANNKTEATLVLWVLSQEIRTLLQLWYLIGQNKEFKSACAHLKIWSQRTNLYQVYCKRVKSLDFLLQLHRHCYSIDEFIKSNLNTQVWNYLENVALSLCLGQLAGALCTV